MRILPTMQEYKQNGILRKQIFRTILLVLVNGSCFGFVIWQTISCTQKYINKPQMTKVSLKDSSELPLLLPLLFVDPLGDQVKMMKFVSTKHILKIFVASSKYLYLKNNFYHLIPSKNIFPVMMTILMEKYGLGIVVVNVLILKSYLKQ